jgi:hypothetical protein
MSPLIQAQADTANFNRQQAAIDLPKARATLGSSLDFWNTILKGDRSQVMSMIGPSADQQAGQTAAANKSLSEFAPRGGRRTLMLGDQPIAAMTDLNRNILNLRAGAPDKQTQIGQILAQLGMGETGAATQAGNSAISGAVDQAKLANDSAAASGKTWGTVGSSIGQILLLMKGLGGSGGSSTNIKAPPVPTSIFTNLPGTSLPTAYPGARLPPY